VLHHPIYRTRFAENLKRDLPRIPFIGVAADVSPLKSSPVKLGKKSEPTHVVPYGIFNPQLPGHDRQLNPPTSSCK